MFLQQILDVDERNQLISVNAWLSYTWQDYKLSWDPEKYDGIVNVRFPGGADHIWKPDILLYNSAAEDFDSTFKSNLVVYSTGDVNWIPPGVLKFVCKLDVTWFPFDDQICEMKFGSWTFHGDAIDLQIHDDNVNSTHSMDLSTYVVNGEWELISSPALREVKFYKCCPEPYPTVKYFLHLRRRTLYYGFNLIIPSLLICLMTVLGFSLPPDAGEKITLEMTILLAIVFFLSMVSEMTPPTSDAVPLIGVFFSCCMLVIAASVVFTVLILNLHFRGPDTHEMSPVLHKVFLEWLPWILCMSRPGYTFVDGVAVSDQVPLKPKMKKLPPIDEFPTTNPVVEAQLALLHKVYDEVVEKTHTGQGVGQGGGQQAPPPPIHANEGAAIATTGNWFLIWFIRSSATSTTRRKVASICNGSTGRTLVKNTRKGMGAGGAPAELAEERRPLRRLGSG